MTTTYHRTMTVDGLEIFYREAGPVSAPTVVLEAIRKQGLAKQ
jgi:hypothetical protein